MVVLEWLGAHLLGPIINLYRAIAARPRPDVRILELKSTGGSGGQVHFSVHIANYGTQQCRCEMSARVGGETVDCRPPTLDLMPNSPPEVVQVLVPRPQLGDLVPQFNNETTLYDKTLRVEAAAGKHKASHEWHEVIYTQEENWQRHQIQQRVWRRGRGEETPADFRSEQLEDILRRSDERRRRGPRYEL
jgi:hypothetical protein